MKETMLMYARYTERANAAVIKLLDGLSLQVLVEDRKSYYKSLAGLAAHILGGTIYFHGLFRASLPSASAALTATIGLTEPEGELTVEGWKGMGKAFESADRATIELVRSLDEEGLSLPIAVNWYEGNPPSVPFHYLANQLLVHGIHHRGQISQILDSMGIEHDFSGIDLDLLPL